VHHREAVGAATVDLAMAYDFEGSCSNAESKRVSLLAGLSINIASDVTFH